MKQATKDFPTDGVKFTVQTFNVVTGREALVRLQRVLGPALGELVEGRGKTGIARAVGSLAERLNTSDLEWFCTKVSECSTVEYEDGRVLPMSMKGVQDDLFPGNYSLMFAWLEFALEVNFRDFLDLLRNATKGPGTAPQTVSASPSPQA
jgi:hypothetical protein